MNLKESGWPSSMIQILNWEYSWYTEATFDDGWRRFWLSRGQRMLLVGEGQGFCQTSYSAQDMSPQQRISSQNANKFKVWKPCFKVLEIMSKYILHGIWKLEGTMKSRARLPNHFSVLLCPRRRHNPRRRIIILVQVFLFFYILTASNTHLWKNYHCSIHRNVH